MNVLESAQRLTLKNDKGEEMGHIVLEPISKNLVNIVTVFTQPAFRGQGLAATMMEELLTRLQQRDCRVVLTCSYAQDYFRQHPQWESLLPSHIRVEKN